jgi:hypothetical protein
MEAQRSMNFNEFKNVLSCKFVNLKVQNEECHYYGWDKPRALGLT